MQAEQVERVEQVQVRLLVAVALREGDNRGSLPAAGDSNMGQLGIVRRGQQCTLGDSTAAQVEASRLNSRA